MEFNTACIILNDGPDIYVLESLRLFTGPSFFGLSWQLEATANNQKTYFENLILAESLSGLSWHFVGQYWPQRTRRKHIFRTLLEQTS